MTELVRRDQDNVEADKEILLIPYEEWHPKAGIDLWERLQVPDQPTNDSWVNSARFEAKNLPDGRGYSREVSHHERLNYWSEKLAPAFVVEHYLTMTGLGGTEPRIVEIGCWPSKNPVVETQYDNTVMAVLAQNRHYRVVGVDKIDVSTAFPYKSYTPPHFGNGIFINEDFNSKATQQKISDTLGGEPQVIVGSWVFEKRLGNANIQNGLTGDARFWVKETARSQPASVEVSEHISKEANDFLAQEGVIVVCNNGAGEIPDFVQTMPLLVIYLDENGRPFAEIRGKV